MTTPDTNKTKGRKRNANFVSYEEARQLLSKEMIPSRRKYDEWFNIHKPKVLPRFPNRVYKEWTSWNDYLGNNNEFVGRTVKWRNINEATVYIHAHKIPNFAAWMEWIKIPGNLPPDIPARPDLTYSKWVSWNHWLGNTPVEAVEAKVQARSIQILYVVRYNDTPLNVVSVGVEPMGISGMKEMWEQKNFEIVKLFWYDVEKAEKVHHIIKNMTTPYLGDERKRVAHNVWDVVWHISNILDTVNLADVEERPAQKATVY